MECYPNQLYNIDAYIMSNRTGTTLNSKSKDPQVTAAFWVFIILHSLFGRMTIVECGHDECLCQYKVREKACQENRC